MLLSVVVRAIVIAIVGKERVPCRIGADKRVRVRLTGCERSLLGATAASLLISGGGKSRRLNLTVLSPTGPVGQKGVVSSFATFN